MRIRHKINVFVSDDTAGECVLYGQDDANKVLQQIDSMRRVASGRFAITGGGTELLPLGDIDDPRGVYIRVDTPAGFDVIWNGGSETLTYRPADANVGRKTTLFQDLTFTAASITNPDGAVEMTGIYVVWGDPLP